MQIYLAWTKRRKVMTRPLSIPEKQRFPRSTNLVLRTVGKIAFSYDLGQELAVLGQPRFECRRKKRAHSLGEPALRDAPIPGRSRRPDRLAAHQLLSWWPEVARSLTRQVVEINCLAGTRHRAARLEPFETIAMTTTAERVSRLKSAYTGRHPAGCLLVGIEDFKWGKAKPSKVSTSKDT